MRNLLLLIPPELAVLLIMGGGFSLMIGAKRLAMTLLGAAMAVIFLPVILAPIFNALPDWLLTVLLVIFGIGLASTLLQFVIGKPASGRVVGTLLSETLRVVLLVPLGLIVLALTTLFRRH